MPCDPAPYTLEPTPAYPYISYVGSKTDTDPRGFVNNDHLRRTIKMINDAIEAATRNEHNVRKMPWTTLRFYTNDFPKETAQESYWLALPVVGKPLLLWTPEDVSAVKVTHQRQHGRMTLCTPIGLRDLPDDPSLYTGERVTKGQWIDSCEHFTLVDDWKTSTKQTLDGNWRGARHST